MLTVRGVCVCSVNTKRLIKQTAQWAGIKHYKRLWRQIAEALKPDWEVREHLTEWGTSKLRAKEWVDVVKLKVVMMGRSVTFQIRAISCAKVFRWKKRRTGSFKEIRKWLTVLFCIGERVQGVGQKSSGGNFIRDWALRQKSYEPSKSFKKGTNQFLH